MPHEWVLSLPWRSPPLSLNDSGGATKGSKMVRNAIRQNVKKAAWALAKQAKVPPLEAVILELVFYPGDNRRRDGDNMAETMKYLTDGLVLAKVLPDDNSERVLDSRNRAVPRKLDPYDRAQPRMVLVIKDASALAPLPHYAPEGQ